MRRQTTAIAGAIREREPIGDVGERIDDHKDRDQHHEHALDELIVPADNAVNEQGAKAWASEHHFDDHGARDQESNLERGDGDHWDQCVTHRVSHHYGSLS